MSSRSSETPWFQNICWRPIEKDTWHWPLLYWSMLIKHIWAHRGEFHITYAHTCMNAQTINTHTRACTHIHFWCLTSVLQRCVHCPLRKRGAECKYLRHFYLGSAFGQGMVNGGDRASGTQRSLFVSALIIVELSLQNHI